MTKKNKGMFPFQTLGLGLLSLAVAYVLFRIDVLWALGLILVTGLLLWARIGWWWKRGRLGAKSSIAKSERKESRNGGVQSFWDHLTNHSATAMRITWARSLQPSRTDLTWRTIFREPVTGYAACLGRDSYGKKWTPVNSITIRIAAARSGKSVALADRVIAHKGPAVVTSTRTDLVDMTARLRESGGPVFKFNAGLIGHIPSTLKWSVLTGCRDIGTAQRRAQDLVGPLPEGSDAARWDGKASDVLGLFMYAAAHAGLRMRAVLGWVGLASAGDRDPRKLELEQDIRQIIEDTPAGAGAMAILQLFFATNDRTRTSITNSLMQSLMWLANPEIADLGDSEDAEFDVVRDLLELGGTLYILGAKKRGVKNLTGALVAEIVYQASQLAERKPGGKLEPALLMALDELALTVPGAVDEWVLDMGGRGVTFDMVVQQRGSVDATWGELGREAILGNANTLLVGPGCNSRQVAEDFSILAGKRTEERFSRDAKGKVTGSTEVEVNVLDPGKVTQVPMGTALMFTRGRMAEIKTQRADTRKDVKRSMAQARRDTLMAAQMEKEMAE